MKDELLFRKPTSRIEQLMREQMLKRRLEKERKKETFIKRTTKNLKKTLPIPIIIGLVASILLWKISGSKVLIETLLSWTIGMTLIAFIITSILSKYEKSI